MTVFRYISENVLQLTKGRVKKNPANYPHFVDKGRGGSPNVDKRGGQGSEKWIAQIAALLDKMPSVRQISF